MKIMHIVSSPKLINSSSKNLSTYFVELLRAGRDDIEVDYLDTSIDTPPHISAEFIRAMYTPTAERTGEMRRVLAYSDRLCARVIMSDILVFGIPMYNFSMPSTFKALIDNLVRAGLTYCNNPDGTTSGNLYRQKILFVTTRGADLKNNKWSYMDALTPALQAVFSFLGAKTQHFVDVQPLENNTPALRENALSLAYKDLDVLAQKWTKAV